MFQRNLVNVIIVLIGVVQEENASLKAQLETYTTVSFLLSPWSHQY